jgi:hypothetical protein
MAAYEAYLSGKLVDEELTTAEIERSIAKLIIYKYKLCNSRTLSGLSLKLVFINIL